MAGGGKPVSWGGAEMLGRTVKCAAGPCGTEGAWRPAVVLVCSQAPQMPACCPFCHKGNGSCWQRSTDKVTRNAGFCLTARIWGNDISFGPHNLAVDLYRLLNSRIFDHILWLLSKWDTF